ncbi:MAG TPA: hypothetical protein VFU32_07420 [Ktedonobacterales bacterium]|nr:hypothetical protein [Ktedonobacterales bacterium]
MALPIASKSSFSGAPAALTPLRAVWTARLVLGWSILLGAICFFLGVSWDIQWHTLVGRDRTLIPPHDVMLTGVGLSGLAALAAIGFETIWARRHPLVVRRSTRFADIFHASLGAYLAGYGALCAAIAFPLDAYWHALFGIDVTIWAPFHIMFIIGMALAALGSIYMLSSAAHLASQASAGARRAAYLGVIVAFGTMFSIFTLLLFNALGDEGYILLGPLHLAVYPVMAALLGGWTLISVRQAVPWRWAASAAVLASLALVVIVALYVPPATDLLVQAEHLRYRTGPGPALVAIEWPMGQALIAALGIDLLTWQAKRHTWSQRRLTVPLALLVFVTTIPVLPLVPWYVLALALITGLEGFLLSLFVLGTLGACVGLWLGRRMGASLQIIDQEAN